MTFQKRAFFGLLLLGSTLPLTPGCSSSQQPLELASLRQSGKVSFICITRTGEGAPLDACPRGPIGSDGALTVADPNHDMFALLTQKATGEVAVIRVSSRSGVQQAQVLDADRSNPGKTPLRVGLEPEDIVTTRGGHASFVGVKQLGRPGIFGLPTKCIFEPVAGREQGVRDITTWPACALSSAPGDMAVVLDTQRVDGGSSLLCGGSAPPAPEGECATDLSEEIGAELGTQKLVVALPEEGKLVVLDAQELLSRTPGTFQPCAIEAELSLRADPPAQVTQSLPPDLKVEGSCLGDSVTYGPFDGPFASRPSGFAHDDETLFVGDSGAPLIHRVDVRDPCAPRELEPLVPTSFLSPERVVKTSRLALSPETNQGERFLYAVDQVGEQASSVMVFDVSEDALDRTPLVRPDSAWMPFEAPDRIEFAASVKDIAFVMAEDPPTNDEGVGAYGVECDPDPDAPLDSLGALARSDSGLVSGAGNVLRGIFAYVLTSDGRVNVVDVEDYDAACRRNARANTSSEFDFRGCRNDPVGTRYFTLDKTPDGVSTVTNEATCRAVVPHRARARGGRIGDGRRGLIITDDSVGRTGAPALVSLPRLALGGQGLPVSRRTLEGRKNPILLGVDFLSPGGSVDPAQVYVGTTLRVRDSLSSALEIDPNRAEQASVVLPFVETRAYPPSDTVTVVYEGELDGLHSGGILTVDGDTARLVDFDANFCSSGVQDEQITRELAAIDFGLSGQPLDAFGKSRADYVQIVSKLLDERDAYWQKEGLACTDGGGFDTCDALFGDSDLQDLRPERDLTILSSTEDTLTVTPRSPYQGDPDNHLAMLRCCFPGPLAYRVRASRQWVVRGTSSGFQHPITSVESEDGSRVCALDCHPLKASRRGRVFELSNTACDNPDPNAAEPCGVGARGQDDPICAYDASRGAIDPRDQAGNCIYDGISRRFAVYRGLEPSVRGMTFSFEVSSGFVIDSVQLSTNQNAVLPVSLASAPWLNSVGVVDSATRGLLMVDVRAGIVVDQFF